MSNYIGPNGGATRFKIAQAPGSIIMWPHKDGKYAPYKVEKIERLRADNERLKAFIADKIHDATRERMMMEIDYKGVGCE